MKKLFIGLSFLIPFQLLTATPEVNAHKFSKYQSHCYQGFQAEIMNDEMTADIFFNKPGRFARKCRNHSKGHANMHPSHDVYYFFGAYSDDPRFAE
tara:strand:+ start:343 stop:630 length:288 start_codon:yes stop_codon:yes gene_type:complete